MLNMYKKHCIKSVPEVYRGGGKSGGGETQTAAPIQTSTNVGDQLSLNMEELTGDTTVEESAISKKKLGTRGLQIPLAKDNATTTAANTGVQV